MKESPLKRQTQPTACTIAPARKTCESAGQVSSDLERERQTYLGKTKTTNEGDVAEGGEEVPAERAEEDQGDLSVTDGEPSLNLCWYEEEKNGKGRKEEGGRREEDEKRQPRP
jgi:hypothetical protein